MARASRRSTCDGRGRRGVAGATGGRDLPGLLSRSHSPATSVSSLASLPCCCSKEAGGGGWPQGVAVLGLALGAVTDGLFIWPALFGYTWAGSIVFDRYKTLSLLVDVLIALGLVACGIFTLRARVLSRWHAAPLLLGLGLCVLHHQNAPGSWIVFHLVRLVCTSNSSQGSVGLYLGRRYPFAALGQSGHWAVARQESCASSGSTGRRTNILIHCTPAGDHSWRRKQSWNSDPWATGAPDSVVGISRRCGRSRATRWTVRANVRAGLRVLVKRLFRRYGYPPESREKATQTVLEQSELWGKEWVA